MDARKLFDKVSAKTSRMTTRSYSTSFSLGIYFLDKKLHDPIYGIYGFVRFADEIVDTFHEHDKERLLREFREDTYKAIRDKISLNPILNSFQLVARKYNIDDVLINTFLNSMEMDLHAQEYSKNKYEEYILGSAEVVGLMCLKVFCNGNQEQYDKLKPAAMKLGSAFQKVNFLRDLKADYEQLGRSYFPEIDLSQFNQEQKRKIEEDIEADFREALEGIRRLPKSARLGVYLAYIYYRSLFKKIKGTPSHKVLESRIRIPNSKKLGLMFNSYLRHSFNLL